MKSSESFNYMVYEIVISYSAKKEIEKLDAVAKKSIYLKLIQLQKDPVRNAKKLRNSDIGDYRWRVGNYRIVFDIEKDKIVILKVGHRREIYKNY